MSNANIKVIHEVYIDDGGWQLCFQWGEYHYDDNTPLEKGYRFIWRDDKGNLHAQRGQARIPSANKLLTLLGKASDEGWFVKCEIDPNPNNNRPLV